MSTDTQIQEHVLASLQQSQDAVVDAVRAWSEATSQLAPDVSLASAAMPAPAVELPSPAEILAGSFDFAEKVLASQRRFAEQLLEATPAPVQQAPAKQAPVKQAARKKPATKS